MENRDNLLIVVDAGHGGWDNGASFEGRLEKDDNLRLALEVQRQFKAQCVNVLMTRDTDVFVELSDRAAMANEANADLFISLHRNSYIEQTPMSNGVENWIYLTAPVGTTERAAQIVLDEVVSVGVQNNRGVKRGDYYVLRRTSMPAMLLEMGYIINEEDNRLFDECLVEYAKAIVRGTLKYFGVYCAGEVPAPAPPEIPPPPTPPTCPVEPPYMPSQNICLIENIKMAQRAMNLMFQSGIIVNGVYDAETRTAAIRALQTAINETCGINLPVTGILDACTVAAIPDVEYGDAGAIVTLLQALLVFNGYCPGEIDGIFGPSTRTAVQMFQRDNYLTPDGIAGPLTITRLLQ